MIYRYDPKTDILVLILGKGRLDFGEQKENIITHYDKKGKPLEIEILEASMIDKKMKEYGHTFTKDRLLARMEQLGLIWNRELGRLLPESEFVKYKDVKEYLMERFDVAGLI